MLGCLHRRKLLWEVFEMPGFGEKFSKFVSNTKKGAQDLVETNKLNSAIHKAEAEIETTYTTIGKSYFETFRDDVNIPGNFRQMLDAIVANMKEIEELKLKIVELQGNKVCPGCGAVIEEDKIFCGTCGHKFEERPAAPVEEDPVTYEYQSTLAQSETAEADVKPVQGTWPPVASAQAPQGEEKTKFCTACGTAVPASSAFCGSCGQKM